MANRIFRFLRLLCTLLFLGLIGLTGAIGQPEQVFKLDNVLVPNTTIKEAGWKNQVQHFNYNKQVYESLKTFRGSKASLRLPVEAGGVIVLELERWDPRTDDYVLTTSTGQKFSKDELSPAFYFKGHVAGFEHYVAAISIFENEVFGMVATPTGNFNIGLVDRKSIATDGALHAIFNDWILPDKNPFECHTADPDTYDEKGHKDEDEFYEKVPNCKTVNIYIELDHAGFTSNGSNLTTATNYINGLFNVVKLLYANDLMHINLSQLHIWTTLDPYPSTSSSAALNAFVNRIRATGFTYNGNLAHLISLKPTNLGGIADLVAICSPSGFNTAFSNTNLSYSGLPVYSWSVKVVAHELGHNFGSKHTHWCGWLHPDGVRRAIDNCASVETYGGVSCYTGVAIARAGTIMSYCHLNGSIDFTQGFGPLPSTTMRNTVNSASCLAGYQIENYSITGNRRVCAGGDINLAVAGITGATYSWSGPNGFSSSNSSISVTNATAAKTGTYNVTVTKNGCAHSGKFAEVSLNGASTAPFSEDLEGSASLPSGWQVINPNVDNTWAVHTGVGGFGASSRSMRVNNYSSPTSTGRVDSLYTPVVSLSGLSASQLRFDVAYAQFMNRADTLTILAAANCGTNYQVVFRKGGTSLSTASPRSSSFTPTSSEWRTETINLSAFSGASSIQFVFVSRSAYGNYIYMDNINMVTSGAATAGIGTPTLSTSSGCPGGSVSVNFSTTGTFNSGNTFTAQLSNSSGSFASGVSTLGSSATSPIAGNISGGQSAGSNYLIRVVASNPSTVISNNTAFTVNSNTVTAPANQTVCTNSGNISLAGSPSGGTWSGTGVTSGGVFTPSGNLGANMLTYSYSSGGCSGSATTTVTVNAVPTVNAGSNQSICANATAFTMAGFSPTGGTWSGNGVNGSGLFTPATGLVGTQTLTYSVTQGGCTSTSTKTIIVNGVPSVNAGNNQSICSNATSISMTGFSPTGGSWSGSGVTSGGVFDPSSASVGSNTITYTVTQNGCAGSDAKIVTVTVPPTVNAGSTLSVCSGDAAFNLTGFSPTGGSWTGSGVNSSGLFTPSGSVIGAQTLTYSVTQNGCSSTDTRLVTVNTSPNVSAGSDRTTCSNASPFSLTGTPTGGTWTGNGVSASGLFTPNSSLVGTQTLTYTVSQSGCSGFSSMTVQLNALPIVNAGNNLTVCSGSSPVIFDDFTPSGGSWSGTGVSAQGTFTPSVSMEGQTITLTYTISQNGCVNSATRTVAVNAGPSVNINSVAPVCANASPFSLSASPFGGTWSGNGVNSSGVFSPAVNLIGSQTITYTVSQNGCSSSSSVSVQVNATPTITFNNSNPSGVCAGGSSVNFVASPGGGTWSGNGINATGVFTPSGSMSGIQTLTYSVNQSGCTASANTQIDVNATINVNAGSAESICNNENTSTFVGSPSGGNWSGNGITSNGVFNPASGSSGNRTLTYTVTVGGCTGSATKLVTVLSAPSVSIGLGPNVCADASIQNLTGATPAGGTWSGVGVDNQNRFDPFVAGPGTFPLTYTVVQNGCTASANVNAIVRALPNILFSNSNPTSICAGGSPATFAANPTGGTWTGNGINASGVFTPNGSMSGAQTLAYAVLQSGCSASANTQINVAATINVNAGAAETLCNNSGTTTFTATPAGGTWSGNGVASNGVFNPATGSPGNRILTYTVTVSGCIGSGTKQVAVVAAPTVNAGSGLDVCVNTSLQNLTGGTPSGGTWSGTGVDNQNRFNPSVSGVGTFALSYRVVQNGCTATANSNAVVRVLPTISFNSSNPAIICANGNAATLVATPTGGNWTGNGVSASGVFTPAATLVGSQTITYTATQNGCANIATITLTVNAAPNVSAGSPETICNNEGTTTFSGTPTGGTWSGTGITAPGVFNPATGSTGNRTLTYTVTVNGCSGSSTKQVNVVAAPTVSAGAALNVCSNAAILNLTGGTPAGGTWSGAGVDNQNRFDPTVAGAGTFPITYRVVQNGCTATASKNAVVRAAPNVVFGTANASSLCTNSPAIIQTATPTGGTWSGNGISASGLFTPTTSMSGAQNITYTVTQNSCTTVASTVIQVNQTLAVDAGSATNICTNAGNQTLAGIPAGGTWSGQGVTAAGVFNPTSGAPGTRTLTYSVSAGGCTGTATRQITIVTAPGATVGTGFTVCSNASLQTLTGGSPSGGTWVGPGVNSQGRFDASVAGSGSHQIGYRIIQNGCTATANMTVVVNTMPNTNAGNNMNFLASEQIVTLTGVTPTGGTWTGTSVTANGAFTTAAALAGDSVLLTYSVTQNGCTGSATRRILVHPVPALDVTSDTVCRGSAVQINSVPFTGTAIRWMRNSTIISGATGMNFTPTQNGRYKVEFRLNGTTAFTAEADLQLEDIPVRPQITSPGRSLEVNTTNQVRWFLAGNLIPGANNAVFEPAVNGIYTCQVSNGNCWSPMSAPFNFTITDLKVTQTSGQWKLFPNPANDIVEIAWTYAPSAAIQVTITDLTGKIVSEKAFFASAEGRVKMDTYYMPAGVYILTWKANEGKGRSQFVVRH